MAQAPSAAPLDISPAPSMTPADAAGALAGVPWANWAPYGAPMPAAAQFPPWNAPMGGGSGGAGQQLAGMPSSKMAIPVVQGAVNDVPRTWKDSRWWHPWQVQPGVTEQQFATVGSTGSPWSSTPNAVIPYDPFFKIFGSNATSAGIGGPYNNTMPITMPGGPGTQPPFTTAAADFPNSQVSNFPL